MLASNLPKRILLALATAGVCATLFQCFGPYRDAPALTALTSQLTVPARFKGTVWLCQLRDSDTGKLAGWVYGVKAGPWFDRRLAEVYALDSLGGTYAIKARPSTSASYPGRTCLPAHSISSKRDRVDYADIKGWVPDDAQIAVSATEGKYRVEVAKEHADRYPRTKELERALEALPKVVEQAVAAMDEAYTLDAYMLEVRNARTY